MIKISNKKDENKEKKISKSMCIMYMCDEIYSNCILWMININYLGCLNFIYNIYIFLLNKSS